MGQEGALLVAGKSELGFKVIIKPADTAIYGSDLIESASALNRSVENCVNEARSQYQWEYKRMRHRPPGEINPYNPDRVC